MFLLSLLLSSLLILFINKLEKNSLRVKKKKKFSFFFKLSQFNDGVRKKKCKFWKDGGGGGGRGRRGRLQFSDAFIMNELRESKQKL